MDTEYGSQNRRGISTFIATLLLIVLVVAAGVVIYSYTMGYLGSFNVKRGNPMLQVQTSTQVGGGLVIYAKNIGSGSLKIDPSANGLAKVYVDGNLISQDSYQVDPVEVGEGVTSTITIPINYLSWSGRTIEIKIFANDGTFTSFQTKVTGSSSLKYTSGASQGLPPGWVSAPITVERRDDKGMPITHGLAATVSLTTSSVSGVFYSDSVGTHQITSVTMSAGEPRASFYYKDSANGAVTITASLPGFGSAITTFVIGTIPSSTSTTLSNSIIILGESITDTATVTGVGPTPTGLVEFQVSTDGVHFLPFGAQKMLQSGSVDSDPYYPLAAGTNYFRASYLGDGGVNYLPSLSSDTAEQLTVNKVAPTVTTTLSPQSIPPSITLGEGVTDTVSVAGLGGSYSVPTGNVQFYWSIDPTDPLSWTSFSTKTLPDVQSDSYTPQATGTIWFKAVYSGDGNYLSSESGASAEPLVVWPVPYDVTFDYTVLGGGSPTPPTVSYVLQGQPHAVAAGTGVPVKVDPISPYSYFNPLADSAGSERWQAASTPTGIITGSGTINPTYYHQYGMTLSYSVNDASTPNAPTFTTNQFGASVDQVLSNTPTLYWFDSGSWSVTDPIGSGSEKWALDTVAQPSSGAVSVTTIDLAYFHQYQVSAVYSTSDGSTPSSSVVLSGTQYGNTGFTLTLSSSPQLVWLDIGTSWSVNNPIPASPTTEQWIAPSLSTSGTVSVSITINPVYSHQYQLTMATNFGTTSPAVDTSWQNAGSSVTISATAPSVGAGEQYAWVDWVGSGIGSYTGPTASPSVTMSEPITETAAWTHQYQLTMVTNYGTTTPAIGTSWQTADALVAISATPPSPVSGERYNWVSWTGFGVDSYTGPTASPSITMSGPIMEMASWAHQFQLLVSTTGTGSGSVTPISGGWYDPSTDVFLTANPGTGSHFTSWSGDLSGTTNPTTITMNAAHSVTAGFDINTYTITVTQTSNGVIAPGTTTVNYGTDQAFTITASLHYHVADVLVDGASMGAMTSYTFYNVVADGHMITASFAINTYTITPSVSGSHGTISPSSVQTVNYGDTPTFTFAPDLGYHVNEVRVDGNLVTPSGNTYQFPAVTAIHTISVSFAINTYTITVTQGTNGVIAPGTTTVDYGGSQTFSITANTGYHVLDVVVDSVSQGAIASYPFTNVQAAHTITATYAQDSTVITEHVTITPANGYTSSDSVSVTGAEASVASIPMDGQPHTFTANPSSTITFTVPEIGANSRYRFAGPSTTWSYTTASSGSDTQSKTVYYQYHVSASYSTSDSSTPSANVILSGTQLGSSSYTLILSTSAQITWLDSGTSWSVNSQIPTSPTTERWYASSGTSGTNISGAVMVNPTYSHQYQVTFTQTGVDSDAGSITVLTVGLNYAWNALPSGAWVNSGTGYTWANPVTVSGNEQFTQTAGSSGSVTTWGTISATYQKQWKVTFAQSGLDSSAIGTVLTVGTTTYTYSQLPQTGKWVNSGTTYSYTTSVSGGTGKTFGYTSVTGPSSPIGAYGTVTGKYGSMILRPNAAGYYSSLDASSGSNYACVDDTSSDGDSTYVYRDGSETRDMYAIPDNTLSGLAIQSITVHVVAREYSGTAYARPGIRVSSNNYQASSQTGLGSSYTDIPYTWTTNLYTSSAWTWTDINNLQIGVYLRDSSGYALCTQVWVEVTYTP